MFQSEFLFYSVEVLSLKDTSNTRTAELEEGGQVEIVRGLQEHECLVQIETTNEVHLPFIGKCISQV